MQLAQLQKFVVTQWVQYGGSGGKLPNDLWLDTLKSRRTEQEQKTQEIAAELPELRQQFLQKFQDYAARKGMVVDMAVIKQRIEAVPVVVADPLVTRLDDRYGSYNNHDNVVLLTADTGSTMIPWQHVLDHELRHVASGRTIQLTTEPAPAADKDFFGLNEEDDITDDRVSEARIGLQFSQRGNPRGRFRWLNEALTEDGTLEQREGVADPQRGTYRTERKLASLLRTTGKEPIPEVLFLNAQHENYDPTVASPRQPHFNDLMRAITANYQSGFLTRLDNVVLQEGVVRALQLLQARDFDTINTYRSPESADASRLDDWYSHDRARS